MSKTIFLKKVFWIYTVLLFSCSPIYHGLSEKSFFNPSVQPNELGNEIGNWEDGSRINGENNEFEWWYFDAELEDGSVIVVVGPSICIIFSVLSALSLGENGLTRTAHLTDVMAITMPPVES